MNALSSGTRGASGVRGVPLRGYSVVRVGRASFLLHRRSASVAAGLLSALAGAVVAALCLGESAVSPVEVLKVVLGLPSPDELVVGGFRLIRLGMALLGIVLASCAAGAAGPVDFVALMAPQIALRLARSAQVPLFCSALTGALVVVLADLIARRLLAPTELPVGVVTGMVGAPYLMWLLIRSRRGGS